MAGGGRREEEDDGRVIADMSDVAGPSLMLPGIRKKKTGTSFPEEDARKKNPWEEEEDLLNPEERRMYVLGALKAALLIGMAFIFGLGAVILVMLAVWT